MKVVWKRQPYKNLSDIQEYKTPMSPQILPGMASLAACYDAFIIDLWGVIHNGHAPYAQAMDVLAKLGALKKTTLLLSNSPRRAGAAVAHLESMGLPRTLYSHIYTSGEDTHLALKERLAGGYQDLGRRLYHLGPSLHEGIYSGLGYENTGTLEEADFILATGAPFPRLEDYGGILRGGLEKAMPLICANPDQRVLYKGEMTLCCGAIASIYEKMGGTVHYHGKPCPAIYQRAFSLLAGTPQRRILAIGDSLATDIKGAQQAGIDNLLVMGGIHRHDLLAEKEVSAATPELLSQLALTNNVVPTCAMAMLRWE